jgi:hypothetical protein
LTKRAKTTKAMTTTRTAANTTHATYYTTKYNKCNYIEAAAAW